MPGCGEILRQKRVEAGWSIDEVHKKTLISVNTINLIEEERWLDLPEDALSRGYIKRYAQLVGLDGVLMWSMVEEARGSKESKPMDMVASPRQPETGAVRLVIKETPTTPSLFDNPEEESKQENNSGDEEPQLPETLRVVSAHIAGQRTNDKPKRRTANVASTPKRPTSITAMGPNGQMPLISSRSEPGTRAKKGDSTLSSSLVVTPSEVKAPIDDSEVIKDINYVDLLSFKSEVDLAPPLEEEIDKEDLHVTLTKVKPVRLTPQQANQRKQVLYNRRRNLLIKLALAIIVLTIAIYAIFINSGGYLWFAFLTWFNELFTK